MTGKSRTDEVALFFNKFLAFGDFKPDVDIQDASTELTDEYYTKYYDPKEHSDKSFKDFLRARSYAKHFTYGTVGRPSNLTRRYVKEILKNTKQNFRKRQKLKAGAAFMGEGDFKIVETDKYYIPDAGYCLIKCLFKYLKRPFDVSKFSGVSRFDITTNKLKYICRKRDIPTEKIPSVLAIQLADDKLILKRLMNTEKIKHGVYIILVPVTYYNQYHAVLVRERHWNKIDIDKLLKKIEIVSRKVVGNDMVRYLQPAMGTPAESYWVYDIETYTKQVPYTKANGEEELRRHQIPFYVGCMKVVDGTEPEMSGVYITKGKRCLVDMLDYIIENDNSKSIQIFAHNGGNFDNLFIKALPEFEITQMLKSGSCSIMIKGNFRKREFVFKDSVKFVLASLKKGAQQFNLDVNKLDYDIANKDRKFFKKNKDDIIHYLKYDVLTLGKLAYKIDSLLRDMGVSITVATGIPSIAWKLANKACLGLSEQFITKDPVTASFIKSSCYGGRIYHYKKHFKSAKEKDFMISLDVNSLYPAAMAQFEFPMGKYKLLDSVYRKSPKKFKKFIKSGVMGIYEVTMTANNIRYPLIPYRKHDGGGLLYPSQEFKGVYNSVDLQEAFKMGYKVLEVHQGIYWVRKGRIMSSFIEEMYRIRKSKPEYNYIFKIILNSIYGKFLQKITDGYVFTKDDENSEELKKLNNKKIVGPPTKLLNGQYQYKVSNLYAHYRNPLQMGSFILAYSRKIMNRLVSGIGPDNVYYGDTDSIYVPLEALEQSDLEESIGLGGFKNDYGEKYIKEAIFLDYKRYYLKFTDGTFKAKFNGVNFKDKQTLCNFIDSDMPKAEQLAKATRKFYTFLRENPGEKIDLPLVMTKWIRGKDNVYLVDREFYTTVGPQKGIYGKTITVTLKMQIQRA